MSSTGTTSDRPDRVDGRRRARWVGRLAAVFAVAVLAGAGTLPGEGGVASAAPSPYWPGHDVARRVVSNPAGPGGWTLSAFGAVDAFGGAPALSHAPNWGRWGIARDLVVTSSGTGGYVLDGWGGIHRLGDAPPLSGAPYWRGFDIARRLVPNPAGGGGWVLDGWGGIHAFGGAPRLAGGPYWRGWDIARDLVVLPSGTGGYVLDGWGGIHPVGDAAAVSGTPYWRGWDIARKLILNPDGPGGWLLDGFGGVHRFDGAPVIPGTPYWRGWDIARDLAVGSGGSDAYVLDGWGGLHHTTWVAAPANTASPVISGTATDGQTLSATDGTWSGTTPITFAYQWQACDDDQGNGCVDISGATGPTYTLGPDEIGKYVRVKVTATNAGGSASAYSALTAQVAAVPPANTASPAISGTAQDGRTLSATPGTWSGTPPMTFSYQWQRCNNHHDVICGDISGATSSAYTLTSAEVGKYVRVKVTATNAAGNGSAPSALTAQVAAAPPVNTAVPVVSGTATDGRTLSATDGTWSGTPTITFAYQWEVCNDDQGNTCADLLGATASTYTLTSAEVGKYLRARVTATNAAGTASANSALTAAVAAAPPVNTSAPTLSGTATDGEELSVSDGTWTGTPTISYSYQWEVCADDQATICADLLGAAASTYTLSSAEVGKYVRVEVTATNSAGTASAYSALSAAVAPALPVNTALGVISGTATDGQTLSTTDGSWTGTTPMTFSYQWQRCDDNVLGINCVGIGADSNTYTLTADEIGKYVKVGITATNSAGSTLSWAEFTSAVAAVPPSSADAPSVTGVLTDGEELSATQGTWAGSPAISYSYQWEVCADAGGTNCADLVGAAASTYTLTAGEVGKYVRVKVTATNSAGTASAHSALTAAVAAAPPVNTSAPTLSGTAVEGQTLSATDGTWAGTPPVSYSYQWESCADDQAVTCGDIVGATSSTYTLTMTEINQYVRVKVTATNSAGTASAYSALTAQVAPAPPVNTAVPVVSGTPTDGEILVTTDGSWTGAGPITYAYQWEACDDAGGTNCADISGATGPSHPLGPDEIGKYVRVKVTATNPGGSTDAYSALTAQVAAAPPVNTLAPTLSGTAAEGQTLSAVSAGSWSGTTPMTFAWQWEVCDDDQGGGCVDISGATNTTYTLTSSEVGKYVRLEVTATNSAGNASAYSAPTGPVAGP